MSALKLDRFGGQMPAWDSRLLPEGQADFALNTYLFSGALIGWRQPKLLRTLSDSAAKFAYRLPNKETNNTLITAPDSFWMEFSNADATVVHTPVVNDQFNRYYYVNPSDPPHYNTYERILSEQPGWLLGLPPPGDAPGVDVTSGGTSGQHGFPTQDPDGASFWMVDNSMYLIPVKPDLTTTIYNVGFMTGSDAIDARFIGLIYSDKDGKPDMLLATGPEQLGITAGVEAIAPIDNGYEVKAGVQVWIGMMADTEFYIMDSDDTNNRGFMFGPTYSNGPDPGPLNPIVGDISIIGTNAPFPSYQVWVDNSAYAIYAARAYVYTWITEYGEESPPSPPTVVNGWNNGTWTVSLFQPPMDDQGVNRNIVKTRIYRTVTNQTGQGTYFYVDEVPVTQKTYVDTLPDETVALNLQLESLYWYPPPVDFQGMRAFPNGLIIGWRANEVWFCEPYRPHAWPPGYVLTTEFPIVGLGVCGQAIIACTQGTPYIINGVHPSTMAMTKINLPEPCLHRGSIVSTDTTVLYVSPNGLIQVSQSSAAANTTESWISRERWQGLTPQQHIRAIKHLTSYFAFGTTAPDGDASFARQGYAVEMSLEQQTSFSGWPQPGGHRLGFSQLSSPNGYAIDNVLVDVWTGVGLLIQNGGIYYYDFTDQAPTIVPYKWRSKVYQAQSAKNLQACKVWFSVPPGTLPQVDRNTNDPQAGLGSNQYGIVRIYADDQLWTTRELRTSGELLRIYSGSKYESWQFEIEGRVNVSNAQFATSVKELGLV